MLHVTCSVLYKKVKHQVPQFIDVEDKVIGPLTFKQFVYVAGGAGISFVIYTFLPLILGLPIIAAMMILSLALAFYKINNKPFVFFVNSSIRYAMSSKLYLWRRVVPKPVPAEEKTGKENGDAPLPYVPKLSGSKLKDLAWSLDITDDNIDN